MSVRDAVLGAVYAGSRAAKQALTRSDLANEFWGYILSRLRRLAGKPGKPGEFDSVQSAITSVLGGQQSPEFCTEGQFLRFLLTLEKWKSHDHYRKNQRSGASEEASAPVPDPNPGPATRAEFKLDGETLMFKTDQLSPDEHYVFFARLGGVSTAQQTAHLGCSESTCRRLFLKARKKMCPDGESPDTP